MPLGLLPRKIYEDILNDNIVLNGGMSLDNAKKQRLCDIQNAILRYANAKLNIDLDWIIEYNELLKCFGINKITFKL